MIFKNENGRCFAVLPNGNVVHFGDAEEMAGVQREYNEMQKLFGHSAGNSELENQNSKLGHAPGKKKVRIRIDPDVEYIENPKCGIRNSKFIVQKEKALA